MTDTCERHPRYSTYPFCPDCKTEQENIRAAVDVVNHPEHYTMGQVECIDAIEAALTPEEFRGYLKGNIIKYTWRERQKGGVESMEKAMWYLRKFIDVFV